MSHPNAAPMSSSSAQPDPNHLHDVIIVGGGPCGATAAQTLAKAGRDVLLLDRPGRIKPCGGAVPPRLIRDFDIPDSQIVARINAARMIAPSDKTVDMPIDGGYVGMVDREHFDPFLRTRAVKAGAQQLDGAWQSTERLSDGTLSVRVRPAGRQKGEEITVRARLVLGADGARSQVARDALGEESEPPSVFAYHEIIAAPEGVTDAYDPRRCDVYYQGELSPDFYAWIFPHGGQASIGVGSMHKGFSLRTAIKDLRQKSGLDVYQTIRTEGAPIPLKPRKRWDNGRDVLVAGDAAGVVAPASGEGIYYAMLCGRIAANALDEHLRTGKAAALANARKRFMSEHGQVFFILGMMQHFWYRNDKRRERFVSICADPDVQELTWQAYMNKQLVKAKPGAHMRIFMKDMAHLMGLARA